MCCNVVFVREIYTSACADWRAFRQLGWHGQHCMQAQERKLDKKRKASKGRWQPLQLDEKVMVYILLSSDPHEGRVVLDTNKHALLLMRDFYVSGLDLPEGCVILIHISILMQPLVIPFAGENCQYICHLGRLFMTNQSAPVQQHCLWLVAPVMPVVYTCCNTMTAPFTGSRKAGIHVYYLLSILLLRAR